MATHEIRSGSQLELGPDDAGRAVSAEEFADAVFQEPWGYERVGGRLVVTPPNGEEYVVTSSPWIKQLVLYKIHHREVVRYVAPHVWVRFNEETDRNVDIGIYLATDPAAKTIPERIPDLIIEMVRSGREFPARDVLERRSDFERAGVKEYMVVDRFKKHVTVFTLAPGAYRAQVLTTADTYTSPLLPGLAIPLAEVLNP